MLVCDQSDFVRAAHLAYWPLPGGAAAVKKPLRCAYALLDSYGLGTTSLAERLVNAMDVEGPVVRQMVERGLNCPPTSSTGRLFDAVAAMLGLVSVAGYDGEPACLLEAAATRASDDALDGDQVARYLVQLRPAREGESLDPEDESLILDPKNAVEATVYDLSMGCLLYTSVIDVDECTACGSCVDACPMGVLEIEDEVAKVVDEESCIGCGACLEECPSGAITDISNDDE